jgi:glycosyltransferase involved in cell wall biosynthesis
MPLVSILMPAYNRELVVADSIRSIQAQTLKDWELIIADDGSTDQTVEICREFEAKDHRIQVTVNDHNLGVGRTRNRLLGLASGKYIAMQDSDDISVPERLEWQTEVLEAKPEIGIVSGVEAWMDFETKRVIWNFPPELYQGEQFRQDRMEMIKRIYLRCDISNPACMFRRSLVEKQQTPFGTYRVNEDWFFFVHLMHRTLAWGIPKVLVWIRRGKTHKHLLSEYVWALREAQKMKRDLYDFYKNDPNSPINYWLYRKSVASLVHWEGRYVGGLKGYYEIAKALYWNPFYGEGWKSFWLFSRRALSKVRRLALGVSGA